MIQDNIHKINKAISSVCQKAHRNPSEITLVAVSKTANVSQINGAIAAGIIHIGENRVQDAKEKFLELGAKVEVTRHMLGHLQSNKAKVAVEIFDMIQSVDNIKLAQEIQKHAEKINKKISILVQVNIAGEEQKSGMSSGEVENFIKSVVDFKNIFIEGFMTIGPLTDDKNITRQCFKQLREIFDQTKKQYQSDPRLNIKYLSMGMSEDFEMAIEEGSNMIRIGRAIFHGN
ncbi:MAG: YggS family pyridoxal phosphate-dependent enzyme [Candidatus Omnitrophica bacterium]|nr:YggS family pyridoxal phosphate-dependent enzyme [Candidatus Omnitrophota bacterium]